MVLLIAPARLPKSPAQKCEKLAGPDRTPVNVLSLKSMLSGPPRAVSFFRTSKLAPAWEMSAASASLSRNVDLTQLIPRVVVLSFRKYIAPP